MKGPLGGEYLEYLLYVVGVGLVVVIGSIPIGADTMVLRCFSFSDSVNTSSCRKVVSSKVQRSILGLIWLKCSSSAFQ